MAGRVVVVGSVNADLVVRVARLPAAGETVTGGKFARYHGGKGGNQAVAAARLAAPTIVVGAVGEDDLGFDALAGLAAEGVSTDQVARLAGATGVALIVVDEAGENQIAVASGANALLDVNRVAAAMAAVAPDRGDVVLVGHEIPTGAVRVALAAARATGATAVLNPAPATGLDRACLALADVLTPNLGELAELVVGAARRGDALDPRDAGDVAVALLSSFEAGKGPVAVLVTLGERGALLVTRDGARIELPAPRVAAVDATGAGDALNGALAASIAAGHPLAAAARRAVVAAAHSTTRHGARGGLLTLAELEAALASG